jgi:galactokinase
MTGAATRAHDLFVSTFGTEPAGSWSAPGRVNLIGEHTDYNDGFVLPFAIAHRTYVSATPRTDGRIRVVSELGGSVVEASVSDLFTLFPARRDELPEWSRYPLGVAWAMLAAAGADAAPGADLAFASDVPVGAGLSSSAAIEGATAGARNALWMLRLPRVAMARAGRTAENEAVGAPTGIMDQMASMLGRPDAAIFLDCRTLDHDVVELGFAAEGLDVVVIDTGVTHAHATGGYADRRAACERAAAALGVTALRDVSLDDLPRAQELLDDVTFRRVRHIVTENQRVLDTVQALRSEGPHAIGELLTASHASMRDDFEISVPQLDTAVEAALAAGAIGARMTGGGFGGAAIAVAPASRIESLADRVREAFADRGFDAPTIFTVTPSGGAD